MKFIIQGGKPMRGEVRIAGAKNAASKLMIASLLTDEENVLENFPNIVDAAITIELCKELGSVISREGATLRIATPKITTTKVKSLTRKNRIPILALGPLLVRRGEAEVPIMGGDRIGPRPVDIHLSALKALGAVVDSGPDFYKAYAPEGLRGADITFRYPSVGATESAILSSVLAEGKTTIRNAAIEPEIIDLIKFLQKMGAIIELGANRMVFIQGVKRLRGAKHRILPDRNEAVSFACLAVATGGEVLVKDAIQEHLITFLNTIRRIGGEYEILKEGIRFWRAHELKGVEVDTDTHPGLMTDWQQPLAVVLTQSQGRSVIHETIYEDRFGYTKDLNLMGADIKVSKECLGVFPCRFENRYLHSAVINGPTPLRGGEVRVPDLRAGMAHVIAALTAKGESVIDGIEEIDRGYEKIDERLRQLGASIERV